MSSVSSYFGSLVFDDRAMRARLSPDVYQSFKKSIDDGESFDANVADAMAEAMREDITEEALADKVMDEYDVDDRERVLTDIRALADKLREVNLLEE